MNQNMCIFSVKLVSDPELRYMSVRTRDGTSKETAVGKFRGLVVYRNYKDAEGKWQSEVGFYPFELWDKGAERFAERYKKGDKCLVICRAKQERWESKEGEKRSKDLYRVEQFYDDITSFKPVADAATETDVPDAEVVPF